MARLALIIETCTRAALFASTIATMSLPASVQAAAPRPLAFRALANHPDRLAASSADVSSIDAIVHAFANSISAPVGGKIDIRRLNSLFVPDGRIVIGVDPKPGRAPDVVFVTPDIYAELVDPGFKTDGFFDRVIANRIERFGIMAHVYSSYGSFLKQTDTQPFRRGVKSFELLQSGGRWYIVQVFYDFERPGTPIPPTYLERSSQ